MLMAFRVSAAGAIDEFTINLAITIIVMVCALALVGGKDDER